MEWQRMLLDIKKLLSRGLPAIALFYLYPFCITPDMVIFPQLILINRLLLLLLQEINSCGN